jgi:hypothetical protein
MAIDQRDVSSTLRFMDDRALQQYAAMHKNDPYIFPLAFQESQNRQKIRMSQQTAQGMQPQPKVADQALAQMAPQPMPEEQGIGALPADNMQQMADGGIAGYDDDANFAARSEPVVMMAGGGVARFAGEGPSLVRGDFFSQLDQQKADQINQLNGQLAIIEPQLRAAAASNDQQAIQLYSQQAQAIRNQISAAREATGNRVGAIDRLTAPAAAPAATDANFRRQEDPRMKPGVAATAQPLITSNAAPKAGPTRKDTPAPATDPSEKTDTGGLDSLISKFTRDTDLAIGEGRNARVGLAAALEQTPKTRAERNAKERAKEGDVFAGREARLAEREKGIAGMGDKYMGLALLQAGAAMMSTPGNIGAALGKGIQVGSERYVAGLDKINAAKDKFAEARDRLEDLRLNRADMTKKEVREDQRAIDDGILQAKKLLVDGATNDLKISNDNQKAIFGVVADDFKTTKTLTADDKKTDKLLAGRLAETKILAAARGDTAGTRQNQVAIDALKAQATNISNQLKDILAIPSNAAKRKPLEDQLARINGQLAQLSGLGTMAPASPVGTSSGVQFLGYE